MKTWNVSLGVIRSLFLGLLLCQLPALEAQADLQLTKWTPLFQGIDMASGETDSREPRLVKITALRIDLRNPSIRFFASPSSEKPGQTRGLNGKLFLEKYKIQAAINANFFDPCCTDQPGGLIHPFGLSISNGKRVSPLRNVGRGSDIVAITRRNQVSFVSKKFPVGAYTAVAGGPILLRNGQNVAPPTTPVHPRSAVGLSKDKRYFYWLTIDGRQPGYSEGATESETARWLLHLGAVSGLNLDGGGSSTLAIEEPDHPPRVLNRPIHDRTPGKLRVVGNFLGVFARPLKTEH